MAPTFYHYRVIQTLRQMPIDLRILLPGQHAPEVPEVGVHYMEINPGDLASNHECLGRYLDLWSHLETTVRTIAGYLLQSDQNRTSALVDALSGKALTDCVVALGQAVLTPDSLDALKRLTGRLLGQTTTRNRIVHGQWVLEVVLAGSKDSDLKILLRSAREYPPSDPAHCAGLSDLRNQKLRSQYVFNQKRILNAGRDAQRLESDLSAFVHQHIPGLMVSPPKLKERVGI